MDIKAKRTWTLHCPDDHVTHTALGVLDHTVVSDWDHSCPDCACHMDLGDVHSCLGTDLWDAHCFVDKDLWYPSDVHLGNAPSGYLDMDLWFCHRIETGRTYPGREEGFSEAGRHRCQHLFHGENHDNLVTVNDDMDHRVVHYENPDVCS